MPTIRVRGLDRAVEAEPGTDLLTACREGHVNVFWGPWAKVFNCRGKGLCGLCHVEVQEGEENLTPRTKREAKRLKNKPESWRLGCCARLQGDLTIDTFPVRHAADTVSPEALHRAGLPEEERKQLEKADWEALKEDPKPREKGPKKGLLAKIRKKKGIDDSDERAEGEAAHESEDAEETESKKGLRVKLGKGKKKPAKKKDAKKPAKEKKPKKGKKAKDQGGDADDGSPSADAPEDAPEDAPKEADTDAGADPASKPKKKFGLKGRS